MQQKPAKPATWLKPAATTIAFAFALAAMPVHLTGSFGLDGAPALAKSEKSTSKGNNGKSGQSKGANKSASAGGSRGNSGNSGNSGAGGVGTGAQVSSAGGDGGGLGGKPKRTDWSKDGALEYKAALADWRSSRGKGRNNGVVASQTHDNDGAEHEEEVRGGTPAALVRAYTKAMGLSQGEVASLLGSWNGMNGLKGNFEGKLAKMENNPDALHSQQLAYLRDSMGARDALTAFTDLGGDPDDPPGEADVALAAAALDPAAVEAAQDVLDARALLDEEADSPGTHSEAEILAASDLVNGYTGEDPQAVVDLANAGTAQDVIDQFDAWNAYQTADAAALDSFIAASRSLGDGADEETIARMRELVDAIAAYGGLDQAIADTFATGEEEAITEEEIVASTGGEPAAE